MHQKKRTKVDLTYMLTRDELFCEGNVPLKLLFPRNLRKEVVKFTFVVSNQFALRGIGALDRPKILQGRE